jgi:hypothetical protein
MLFVVSRIDMQNNVARIFVKSFFFLSQWMPFKREQTVFDETKGTRRRDGLIKERFFFSPRFRRKKIVLFAIPRITAREEKNRRRPLVAASRDKRKEN